MRGLNTSITKSWSVVFNSVALTLRHISCHVILFYSCTIFLVQILLIRSWPKTQHTINLCRGWVKELSLSKLSRFDAWTMLLQKQKAQEWKFNRRFYFLSTDNTSLPLLLWGTPLHYIGLSFLSEPYTCWSSKPPLEHLSYQTPLSLLCELQWPR